MNKHFEVVKTIKTRKLQYLRRVMRCPEMYRLGLGTTVNNTGENSWKKEPWTTSNFLDGQSKKSVQYIYL